MTQLAPVRALAAACTLRQLLDREETVCSPQVGQATARLVVECDELIGDLECLISLAFVRQRIQRFMREDARAETAEVSLRLARHALLRLIERLWDLLNFERGAHSRKVSKR